MTILEYGYSALMLRSLLSDNAHGLMKQHLHSNRVQLTMLSDADAEGYAHKFSRRYLHNPKFLIEAHHQLTEMVSNFVGESVKPSYAFLSVYDGKGRCPLHVDRPQCQWTLDYMIEQDVDEPWPLYISNRMTEHERRRDTFDVATEEQADAVRGHYEWASAVLKPNDAVIYSGTHQWHYREPIKGRSCALAFFHFVPEGFDGPLN